MNTPSRGDITRLLIVWSNGDLGAFDHLMPMVYDELKRIARSKLRQHGSDRILQPTSLVHEAYIRLVDQTRIEWRDRAHFYAIAANTIRRILVDDYRHRTADKRGGGARDISLSETDAVATEQSVDLLALDEAMEKLAAFDQRQVEIIDMRFFGGLTNEEIAEALGVSVKTVEREWKAAKAWLRSHLE